MTRTSTAIVSAAALLLAAAVGWADDAAPEAEAQPEVAEAPADVTPPASAPIPSEPVQGGDYIRTKAGVEFRGKITEEAADKVTIVTASGPVVVPRGQIDILQKAGMDMRPPSERIPAADIPAGQASQYIEKAGEHALKGEHESVVAICKGLMALKPGVLAIDQLPVVNKMASQAYFYLNDWKAAGDALQYASRFLKEPVDQERLAATAEALLQNEPPTIAGQTAENFLQAQQLAMNWKADRLFDEARTTVENVKDPGRQDVVDQALKLAEGKLAKSEVFVPGYSGPRWPEICKALVTRMVTEAGQAVTECTTQRDWLTRYYMMKFSSPALAAEWNEKCMVFLVLRHGGAGRVANVEYVENNYPLKAAYKDDELKALKEQCSKLAEELEKLRYYDRDTGIDNKYKTKGKLIQPSKIGGG